MTTLKYQAVRSRRSTIASPGIIKLPHGWKPRPYQERLWNYMEGGGLRGLAVCHRRWGKDDLALNWTGVAAHQRVGTYWHLLPEYAQGRKAIWDAIDEERGARRIDLAFPEGLRARTDEQQMFIRFKCGSTWQVIGSDNYNAVVGSPPVGIVFSEWPLAQKAAWGYLSPILEKNGGWAQFIYTPRGRNHGYDFWKLSQSDPDWFGIKQSVDDTDVFTPAQLDKIKANLIALYGEEDGEALFMQEYYCSFDQAIMGSYYGRLLARLGVDNRITSVPYNPEFPVFTAWDLGVDDATAVWFFQIIGREVRVIDYYEVRNRGLLDTAKYILQLPYVYAEHYLPHDVEAREIVSAVTRKSQLESIGLHPIRAGEQLPAAEKIAAVRRVLPICVFDERKTSKGREALSAYHVDYDEKTMTPRKNPKHDWSSHPADAFAELALSIDGIRSRMQPRSPYALTTYDPHNLPSAREEPAHWWAEQENNHHQETSGIDDYNPFS